MRRFHRAIGTQSPGLLKRLVAPSPLAGRRTMRVVSATSTAARAAATISAIAKVSSRTPSPDAADTGKTRSPR